MTRKALALFLAYSFLATSIWSLTADGFRALELRRQANWNAMKSLTASKKLAPRAGTSNALNSSIAPLSAASPVLNSAISAASVPMDGGSSNCTVHTTQPSSDSDSGDSDQGYGSYARHDYKYGSNDNASGVTPAVVASGVTIFGPQTFVRTTGPPNEFDQTITVPAWIAQPFYLHVVNGDSSGNHRVSSATVSINGVALLVPSDFNQQVASADCAVTLTVPTSALHVELASKPGSFLTINLLGQNQDHTPPTLSITAPANGSSINTTTPHIALSYSDVKGATEPAASGVNVPSLKVLLDGVDRTSLFTERPNDASADVPSSLALSQGPHTITATIQDNAGNTATATSQFQVVTQSGLVLQIVQPPGGAILSNLSVPVQITYSDSVSINTSTLKVTVNGVDRTSAFTVTASGATATVTGQQGANQIVASISDVSSQQATASAAFNIDTVPPTITILHPTPGSTHGSSAVEYSVQYTDDQALDLTSLKISVDGTALAVTPGPSTASGTVTLADGNHTLTALIKDKAGNQATASSTFSVDTTAPSIHIVQPAPGAIQNVASLQVQVTYGDNENINTGSLKITIDGTDETSFFTVTSTSASASLPGPFAEGPHSISAQIADQTGNIGQTSSTFVVDTIKPALTIVSPVGPINTASPSALAQYSDSGTGINTSSVHVFVDGSEVTAGFSIGNASVTGTLAGLSEGPHQLRVTVADRAGNVADQTVSFLVDVTPPAVSFASPANNVFINNTQPLVNLNYSDSGSGINQATIHIFLQAGSNPETEITSAFTIGASQASGTIGTPTPLVPGTYHLRAQIADNAGNSSTATSAFQVDTQPPTYTIQLPAANSFLNTATPALLVTYQDDASGVDPSQFAIRVDGIDRTNRLTVTATSASGTLLAADALADGTHQVEVTVVDRAGNSAPVVPQSFLVDTTPPTIAISTPVNGGFTNNNLFPISVSYSDSGSGIDITKFQLAIDGVDQTAQFTTTATGATGVPSAILLDGLHTVTATIKDLAGNPATATATIVVDTVPPQITITQPANGLFTNAASLVVTGSVVDASPVTVTVEGTAVPVQNNTFTSAGITLGTSATQLIHVVATDAAGNSNAVTLTVNIDRTPPTITGAINPPPNAAGWNNTAVTVSFICSDSGSGIATCPAPVPVMTEGANQAVTGTAVDNAGNTAQATVTVNIDKTPPVITGTPAPAPNAANWNTTDVTITYVCSDSLSGVVLCPAPKVVSTEGKAQQITSTVSDVAGNTAASTVLLNIEKTAPTITASFAPPANPAGWNNTNVTVSFVCTPSASDIVSCQTPISVATEGKGQVVSGTVTDQAGKSNSTSATVNIDKTPPLISANPTPAPNAAGWNNTDVVISYLCSDSLSGISICPPPVTVSTEGAAESISAQATDQAGNTSAVTTTLNIDKTPPVVTASAAPAPNGAGWNNTNVTVTFSCTDSLSGVASCPQPQLVASEGQNQNISRQATDLAGNVGTGSITLNIDKTPPTIVQLSTPDTISRLRSGQISVTVNDNFFVSQVVISVNGTSLGTFTSAPYQAALQLPAGANPGDTLTVTAVATDEAGNTQSASRTVRVAADGVIVGQVLSDATSFPIQGAVVQAISATGSSDQTDDHGRYSLLANDPHLFLSASSASPATTTVEREVFVQDGVGTVPVDARLTPLAAPLAIGSAGGTLTAGNVSITVPAGAVGDGTTFQLTSLSGQGLPGLLPLGWSPLAAFDFRASSSAMNLSATITQLPNMVVHLAAYNPALHAWTTVATNLQVVGGGVAVVLPSSAAYALVVPDVVIPPITVPGPGNILPGIPMQLLDAAATSSGSLNPAILPPTGGTATATLGVQTTAAVPSGTVIQANISEKFSLTSGDVVSEETRSEDIVIYNALAPANSTLGAQFAVAPSHKYTNAQLLTGKVHLDILAGREGVRGQPGGSNPVTLTDGIATLSVPGGALSQDTAIAVQGIALEDFVPTNGSIGALQEILVDFSGETLNTAGQLSISSNGLNPAHTFFLTQVQRIDGIPHIVLVALAQINGSSLTSVATPGLPGITQGGEYVFYDVSAPVGFVQGIISSSAGPVQALVQTDSLPVVSITGANGLYIVPAIAGTANLKANSPHTNLAGSASVQVAAGQTTQTSILLAGTVTSAVVTPADGSLGVPVSTTITITTTAALNPQSISQANLVLLKGTVASGTPVPLQPFVLSTSGTVLSLAPVTNLDPATQYTIQVAGLADTFGGAVVVPVSSFTTKAAVALNFDPNAITFSYPDANGNIQVTAPAGSLPPGTRVLIIDQTSGLVLSLTALNDGSVSGNFPGTINDVLQVTVTDPTGANLSFTKSQYLAPDGSTAVGAGGGTVTGPGGVELRIPAGALVNAANFKIQFVGPDQFADRPNLPGASFGGALQVTSPDMPTFSQEVKLAFPKPPDAPDGAFFYVYRRITSTSGDPIYEVLDHAFVEGTGPNAKVVTASYPFMGNVDSISTYRLLPDGTIGLDNAVITMNVLMFTIDLAFPLLATAGVVTGLVRRPHFGTTPGSTVQYDPIPGVVVSFADANGNPQPGLGTATSQADGRFTIWNPFFQDASRKLVATVDGVQQVQPVYQFLPTDITVFQWLIQLNKYYPAVAQANFTFAPLQPPPPAPDVSIHTFTGAVNQRKEVFGTVIANTPLTIGFKSNNQFTIDLADRPVASIQQAGVQQPLSLALSTDTDTTTHKMDVVASFTPGVAGSYTIKLTMLPPLGGAPQVFTYTFLVIADATGSNNHPLPGTPPDVITGLLVPQDKQHGVSTQILPQVVFNQPVLTVFNNLQLLDGSGNIVNMVISAVGVDSTGNSFPIADLSQAPPGTAVTAVTMQPTSGLQFGVTYTIALSGFIRNTDPNPLFLTARNYTFTTFTPTEIADLAFASAWIFVADNRAYVSIQDSGVGGHINGYNISDPVSPQQFVQGFFPGHIVHMAGQKSSPVAASANLLAIGSTEFVNGGPSNIWFYKDVTPANQQGVSTTGLQRIGAVSVTGSVEEGTVIRVAVKDGFAYAVTFPKGIQMIDLNAVLQDWANAINSNSTGQMFTALSSPGAGWATDAIVTTTPIPANADGSGFMLETGLGVDDFLLDDGSSQTLAVATGRLPLLIVNPQTATNIFNNPTLPPSFLGSLTSGFALALGRIPDPNNPGNDRQVALIVGFGSAPTDPFYTSSQPALSNGPVLAIIDITRPSAPVPLGFFLLPSTGTDIQVSGTKAYIASSTETDVIDFSNPAKPVKSGKIPGLTGRLAAAEPNLVLATTLNGQQGLHIAQLDQLRCSQVGGAGAQSVPPAITLPPNFGWTVTPQVTQTHGYGMSNVLLEDRTMADSITVPFFSLQTADLQGQPGSGNLGRCHLEPNGTGVCQNSPTSRSRLIKASTGPIPLASGFALEAIYVVDRLFGDPEVIQDPQPPEACIVITQRYEFYKEGSQGACEATGGLGCGVWKPMVSYKYLHDVDGPSLKSVTPVQRMYFDPAARGTTPGAGEHGALFHDCEFLSPEVVALAVAANQLQLANTAKDLLTVLAQAALIALGFDLPGPALDELFTCTLNPASGHGFLGIPINVADNYKNQNPLLNETNIQVVQFGQPLPRPESFNETVDNLHLTFMPKVAEPLANPGCPECVHVHWRWASFLKPGFPHVDPTFRGGEGNPLIPSGSNQDLSIAMTEKVDGDDDPQVDFQSLGSNGLPLTHPVFWYAGTGHQPTDSFFTHGGFFATLWPENFSYDPSLLSRKVTFHVQHAPGHQVTWTAKMTVGPPDLPLLPAIPLPSPSPSSGTIDSMDMVSTTVPILAAVFPNFFQPPFDQVAQAVLWFTFTLTDQATGSVTKVSYVIKNGVLQDILF